MRQPVAKVAKPIIPQIRRYTIDLVSKYGTKSHKNLVQTLFMFPNFGQGFKIFMKIRKQEYYIIDNVTVKNNKHGKLFGISYKKGFGENKIKAIRNTLKEGRWQFEPSEGTYYTDNAVEYDIKKTEDLIEEKKTMLRERSRILELEDFRRKEKEEKKKATQGGKKKK